MAYIFTIIFISKLVSVEMALSLGYSEQDTSSVLCSLLLCHVILSANQFNAVCNNACEFLYVNKAILFYALEKTSDLLK